MAIIIKILVIENDSQTHKTDKIKLLIHSQSFPTPPHSITKPSIKP